MLTKISSVSINWLEWNKIDVEVDIANWMPNFNIVWLADTAILESRERIRTAIRNSWLHFPQTRITVNLAPADIRKSWPSFDLPIAVWILWTDLEFKEEYLLSWLFIWELALDWKIRWVSSVLPSVIFAKENCFNYVFLPKDNLEEAKLIPDIKIIWVSDLWELLSILIWEENPNIEYNSKFIQPKENWDSYDLLSMVIWQSAAKRALLIAAAWWHNILLEWPPWSWKTMLAKGISSILPPMELSEIIEASKIYSVAWLLNKEKPLIIKRPFRTIHHTASTVSVIWWGRDSRPWEISLAHKWVLFLDEFLEFESELIETLRQPMEDGEITINRINASYRYPAKFMLIWALNPCPCWFYMDKEKECKCSQYSIERYRKKLSWPMLDRIDIFINVPRVKIEEFWNKDSWYNSLELQQKVIDARKIQLKRFIWSYKTYNSEMDNKDVENFCTLWNNEDKFIKNAVEKFDLSTRVYFRTLKLARTIADLNWSEHISVAHIAEALSLRWSH